MRIIEEELMQALITTHVPEKKKKGIKRLDILMFILITIRLITVNEIYGIKYHALFVASITILLPSVVKE